MLKRLRDTTMTARHAGASHPVAFGLSSFCSTIDVIPHTSCSDEFVLLTNLFSWRWRRYRLLGTGTTGQLVHAPTYDGMKYPGSISFHWRLFGQ